MSLRAATTRALAHSPNAGVFSAGFPPVFKRAVAYWRAGVYNETLDALLDLSGNGLHARLGSAVGADTNDPLRLQYAGRRRVYLPGSVGNNPSTPDGAAVDVTGDMTMEFRCYEAAYASSTNCLVGKYNNDADGSFLVRFNSGSFRLGINIAGTVYAADSEAHGVLTPDSWLKIARIASTGLVKYFLGTDGTNWTQLGADVGAQAGNLSNSTNPLFLGATGGTGNARNFLGFYDNFRLYSGVSVADGGAGATLVASFDASRLTEPYASYTDPQGNVWTLNRSATGRKLAVVDRDLLLLGTDDYLEVADSPLLNFGAGQVMTVAAVCRTYGTQNDLVFIAKRAGLAGSNAGYSITRGTSSAAAGEVANGTNEVAATASAYSAGVAALHSLVRDGTNLRMFLNGSGGTAQAEALGSLFNTEVLRIGRLSGAGASYNDMELIAAAIFREALTADELIRLRGEMLT